MAVLDRDRWTALMIIAYICRPDSVERLLKDPRVITTIDTQARGYCGAYSAGSTALHVVSRTPHGSIKEKNEVLEKLLLAGADATIRN